MKKNKIWRLLWLLSLNAALAIILYLVVIYKVTWETKDFNTYLYFYDCNNNVCSTTNKPSNIYSKIVCDDGNCPYVSGISDDILILTKENVSWLYDYKKGEVYDKDYVGYKLIDNGYYIVTDSTGKEGIIDSTLKTIVSNKYDQIQDYNFGLVVHKKDNLFGIDYESGDKVISPKFDEVIIINNTMYAAKSNGKYLIYNIVNNSLKDNNQYDYLWTNNDLIIVIKDKKLDILNNLLESKLLMKIDTYFSYNRKSEIDSLNIRHDNEYIYFNVIENNNKYVEYKYSIQDGKILSNK